MPSILDTYAALHPESARLYAESLRIFPSGVTHDVRYLQPFPIYVERASSSRKWDADGNEVIDYVMGHGALFMGHAHPAITSAIVEQAQKGTHFGANHRLELTWGALVRDLIPSAEEIRFTSSGTEATLMAIRLARAYTGRDRILKFDQHFHGWHDGVVGSRAPEEEHPHSSGVPAATMSNTISVPQGDVHLVEEKLAAGDVAALILEPTGASWGTLPLRPDFLRELREVTAKHNVVLIFDEVVTGFRVAPGGVQGRYGITPDLTSLAKILAGGMPGGAVCGRRDIISMIEFRDGRWNAEQRVQHPGTFNANPMSAAAGSAMLQMVKTGQHHRQADALNEKLVLGLNKEIVRARVAGSAYGLASYFHITFASGLRPQDSGIEWSGDAAPPRMPGDAVSALKRGMLNHGVDLMGGNGGFVSGMHSETDIEATLVAFKDTLAQMKSEGFV